jgi:hypothetical protein
MKKNKLYLLCGFFLFISMGHAQSVPNKAEEGLTGIYLEEFKLMIYPQKCPDTIVEKLSDTASIKFYLHSPKGKSTFYIFNLKNEKQLEGSYADALDVFKRYVTTFDMNQNGVISVEKYYQPIPVGEWQYYSNKGLVLRKVKHYYHEK